MKNYFKFIVAALFVVALVLNVKVSADNPLKVKTEVAKAADEDWCRAGGHVSYCYNDLIDPVSCGNNYWVTACNGCTSVEVSDAWNMYDCVNPECLAW